MEMTIEREDFSQIHALSRRDKRRVSKVHGKIRISAHQCRDASCRSRHLNDLDSFRVDKIEQGGSAWRYEMGGVGKDGPRCHQGAVKCTEKVASLPVPAIAPIEQRDKWPCINEQPLGCEHAERASYSAAGARRDHSVP